MAEFSIWGELLFLSEENTKTTKTHFDKCDLASALIVVEVTNDDVPVVLEISLLTEHIVDASDRFIPLIMITVAEERSEKIIRYSDLIIVAQFRIKKIIMLS